ncbi:hypothetical protein ACIQXG_19385 [Lysinibacillus sphaericus]|uniref:hypothetical protein n=1 Tax=Lysinibacillus sphaericus TaxID=1421 RepID=UPI00381AB53B
MSNKKLEIHLYRKGNIKKVTDVFEVDENEKIVIGDKEFDLKEIGQISIVDKDHGYNSENIKKCTIKINNTTVTFIRAWLFILITGGGVYEIWLDKEILEGMTHLKYLSSMTVTSRIEQ